jgi:y4mF family transcriptional regulator
LKKFYVYQHIDPQTKKVFYVGKGTGRRANDTNRNNMWKMYVKQLEARGLTFCVNVIHICDDEADALKKESDAIRYEISSGNILTNSQVSNIVDEAIVSALMSDDSMPSSSLSISEFVKRKRKALGYTQPQLADRAGVGLRFLRDLERGKLSLRIDKINAVLIMFGSCLVPYKK